MRKVLLLIDSALDEVATNRKPVARWKSGYRMHTPRILSWAATGLIGLVCLVEALRADSISDTLTAQAHLKQLAHAVNMYISDNSERLDDPIRLWEAGYIVDPQIFWNPADSDPAPDLIETSTPNATNSSRISFEFVTGIITVIGDHPLIWDNTPDNNEGGFISYVTLDGAVETDPPNLSPVPSNVAITQAHLKRLWSALNMYQLENGGKLPSRLFNLNYGACYGPSPRNFWNPGDNDPMPTVITNDTPDMLYSARVSFNFPVAGLNWNDIPDDAVVLADNSAANNGGFGINVVDRRGFTRFVTVARFGDATGDNQIDLLDFAKLQQCYTGWDIAILNSGCRPLDWDGNDHLTLWADHEHFVQVLTGPQP